MLCFITVRNVVAARLCFYRRMSFCSQGGHVSQNALGRHTPRLLQRTVRILLECILVFNDNTKFHRINMALVSLNNIMQINRQQQKEVFILAKKHWHLWYFHVTTKTFFFRKHRFSSQVEIDALSYIHSRENECRRYCDRHSQLTTPTSNGRFVSFLSLSFGWCE